MLSLITSDTASVAGGDQYSLAKRDGCGCPEWVLRCVHFAGKILILIEGKTDCCGKPQSGVVLWLGTVPPTGLNCWGCTRKQGKNLRGGTYPDLPSAIAEFEERERQLLGREA